MLSEFFWISDDFRYSLEFYLFSSNYIDKIIILRIPKKKG